MNALGKPIVRAAVYTRKSSDEGLDQEFNSLDAQHEGAVRLTSQSIGSRFMGMSMRSLKNATR